MRLVKINWKLVSKKISPFDPVLLEVQKRDIEAVLLADQLLSFPSVPEKHKINSETTQRKVYHDRLNIAESTVSWQEYIGPTKIRFN